jgi:hypothetical protein
MASMKMMGLVNGLIRKSLYEIGKIPSQTGFSANMDIWTKKTQ